MLVGKRRFRVVEAADLPDEPRELYELSDSGELRDLERSLNGNPSALLPDSMTDREAADFLNHPAVAQRLVNAARSLEKGEGTPHAEVLRRFGHGKA